MATMDSKVRHFTYNSTSVIDSRIKLYKFYKNVKGFKYWQNVVSMNKPFLSNCSKTFKHEHSKASKGSLT